MLLLFAQGPAVAMFGWGSRARGRGEGSASQSVPVEGAGPERPLSVGMGGRGPCGRCGRVAERIDQGPCHPHNLARRTTAVSPLSSHGPAAAAAAAATAARIGALCCGSGVSVCHGSSPAIHDSGQRLNGIARQQL